VDSLVREGLIDGRMLPKIEGCVRALKGGAAQAQLVDGRVPHAVPMTLRARMEWEPRSSSRWIRRST
jgi:acetylglutamate kinase